MKECPFCVGFPCVECKFCTKFYNNGQRIIKRTKTLPDDSEERYSMPKSINDESDLFVPASYTPMTEKEAEVACSYDYPFEDFRTLDELVDDLNLLLAKDAMGRNRLF